MTKSKEFPPVTTLNLTSKDYANLIMMLGFACGAASKEGISQSSQIRELIDWILFQGGGEPYWQDWEKLREKKLKELGLWRIGMDQG